MIEHIVRIITRPQAASLRTKIFLVQGFLCLVLMVVVGITILIINGTIEKHQHFTRNVNQSVGEFAAGIGKTVLITTQSYQRVIETQLDSSFNLINHQESIYENIESTKTLMHKMQNSINVFVINNDPYHDIEEDMASMKKKIDSLSENAELQSVDEELIRGMQKALQVYLDIFEQVKNSVGQGMPLDNLEDLAVESIPLGQLLEKRVNAIVDRLKDIHKVELEDSIKAALTELKKIDNETEKTISLLESKQKSMRHILDAVLREFAGLTESLLLRRSLIGFTCVLGILISLLFSFVLVGNINRLVKKLIIFSNRIAKGDLDIPDQEMSSGDELSDLARDMNEMKNRLRASFDEIRLARKRDESIVERLKSAVEIIRKIGQGDLSHQLRIDADDSVGELAATMNTIVNELQMMLVRIQESAYRLSSASSNLAAENKKLAGRTNQQTNTLEQTASSLEEMEVIVNQNAKDASNTYEISLRTTEIAESVRLNLMRTIEETVSTSQTILENLQTTNQNVVEAMSEIFSRSQKVSGIITLINDIAFQTNLLSLNAAVEAARAGEQGKGFAVVAAEIRNLAWRSSKASKEIDKLISSSLEQIEKGTALGDSSDRTMREMREILERMLAELKEKSDVDLDKIHVSVTEVSELVNNIKKASVDQAAGINQVNQAVSELEKIALENSQQVEKATAASMSLADEAENMSLMVEKFKLSPEMQFRLRQQISKDKGVKNLLPFS